MKWWNKPKPTLPPPVFWYGLAGALAGPMLYIILFLLMACG